MWVNTMYKTLVLDRDYSPISLFPLHTIPAEDAVTRIFAGTCEAIENYPRKIKTQSDFEMYWPSIIRRLDTPIKKFRQLPKLPDADILYYRDHCVCGYCGKLLSISQKSIDHVMPKCRGGEHVWENVVLSCEKCNFAKGKNLPVGQWKPKILPWVPTYSKILAIRKKFPIDIADSSWIPYLGDWRGEIRVAKMATMESA